MSYLCSLFIGNLVRSEVSMRIRKWMSGKGKAVGLSVALALVAAMALIYNYSIGGDRFELTDELGGNIFPSVILATAATDAEIVQPSDSLFIGNPKSMIAVRVKAKSRNTRVRIELEETPFYARSVSEFLLEKPNREYLIFPDILWDYEALRTNTQPRPVNVVAQVERNGRKMRQQVRVFSVRSINDCLLGYVSADGRFHDTSVLFAAYVNEEHPMIDQLLREALNTRIVPRFVGYQSRIPGMVDKQVYALWHVLQKRQFQYSSVAHSSLSSNVAFAQRVRTLDDALESAQVNCVDGSVLFASLLRAVNIDPVLVRTPERMYVGYYTDKKHTGIRFFETTMIGNVHLEDYFPGEKTDSLMEGKTQNEMSLITFNKAQEYAEANYAKERENFHSGKPNYMFLEISKDIRSKVQSIGR